MNVDCVGNGLIFSHVCIEVAQYINLPEAVLLGFLDKCNRDEEQDIEWIRTKWVCCRLHLYHADVRRTTKSADFCGRGL